VAAEDREGPDGKHAVVQMNRWAYESPPPVHGRDKKRTRKNSKDVSREKAWEDEFLAVWML
jgi:hypothetical protein